MTHPLSDTQIASLAFEELRRQENEVKSDDLELAELYASMGRAELEGAYGGVDPNRHAPVEATLAIKEYVKSLLIGVDPASSQNYMLALRKWRKKAFIYANRDFEFDLKYGHGEDAPERRGYNNINYTNDNDPI